VGTVSAISSSSTNLPRDSSDLVPVSEGGKPAMISPPVMQQSASTSIVAGQRTSVSNAPLAFSPDNPQSLFELPPPMQHDLKKSHSVAELEPKLSSPDKHSRVAHIDARHGAGASNNAQASNTTQANAKPAASGTGTSAAAQTSTVAAQSTATQASPEPRASSAPQQRAIDALLEVRQSAHNLTAGLTMNRLPRAYGALGSDDDGPLTTRNSEEGPQRQADLVQLLDRFEAISEFASRILSLQFGVNRTFIHLYNQAVAQYLAGDWAKAKVQFERLKKMKPDDKPTQVLLEFMREHNFLAPADWKGYRPLSKK